MIFKVAISHISVNCFDMPPTSMSLGAYCLCVVRLWTLQKERGFLRVQKRQQPKPPPSPNTFFRSTNRSQRSIIPKIRFCFLHNTYSHPNPLTKLEGNLLYRRFPSVFLCIGRHKKSCIIPSFTLKFLQADKNNI